MDFMSGFHEIFYNAVFSLFHCEAFDGWKGGRREEGLLDRVRGILVRFVHGGGAASNL